MEHTRNHAVDCRKKAVKKRTVFKKKRPQRIINGKNTMPMLYINNLKRHSSSSVNGIHVTTSWTEARMTTKSSKFEITTIGTNIHGAAIRWIATMNHFFYILNNSITRMLKINHFFIMFDKNFL